MQRIVFNSDNLDETKDDMARFRLWRDVYASMYGEMEFRYSGRQPFSMSSEFVIYDGLCVARGHGTIEGVARTAAQAATSPQDIMMVSFNTGGSPWGLSQAGREHLYRNNDLMVLDPIRPYASTSMAGAGFMGISVERAQLEERVRGVNDLVMRGIDPTNPAVGHLRRYFSFLLQPENITDDPLLNAHISGTVLDLVALALTPRSSDAETARGLRGARRLDVMQALKNGFSDPGFSAQHVAAAMGLSPRYIQELLQDTGSSFTERLNELRLQKAREMLSDPRFDRLKISDIALGCGFNEVSYFNRLFRRRFGATPSDYRRERPV